jgi:hypothetical protein
MFLRSNAGAMIMMAAAMSIGMISMGDFTRHFMAYHFPLGQGTGAYSTGDMNYGMIYEARKKARRGKIIRRNASR